MSDLEKVDDLETRPGQVQGQISSCSKPYRVTIHIKGLDERFPAVPFLWRYDVFRSRYDVKRKSDIEIWCDEMTS